MSQKYDCPKCGGAVAFQSGTAMFAVCPYCRSMVVRHDVNIEAIGVMAELPPDLSPLQIGATGEFEGRGFSLIGRVRKVYPEGSWTEWYALFGDGSHGWIGEAQGFFTIAFEQERRDGFSTDDRGLRAGTAVAIGNANYTVVDRKKAAVLWGEGELPFVANPGRESVNIDCSGPGGGYAGAEYASDGLRLYSGRFAKFADLNFTRLRAVPGWSEEPIEPVRNQTSALSCPSCGSTVQLRAAGLSMSAACGSCGALLDTATPDLKLLRVAASRETLKPLIPFGTRGDLAGVTYELIGFQHVKDKYSGWYEYLLFNPWHGFIWLVNYQGHWSLVERLTERPDVNRLPGAAGRATFRGEDYRIFDDTMVTTDYVSGEFYWKVALGQEVRVRDYVNPPKILSRESYPALDEDTWSQGVYVEPEVIRQAFKLAAPLPDATGIYLNQPNPHAERSLQLPWLVPVLLLTLFAIQLLSATWAEHRPVIKEDHVYQAGQTNGVFVSDPFQIVSGRQAVDFNLRAPVNNSWIEIEGGLVNTNTGQTVESFVQTLQYYSGYDDGPWSEGRQSESVTVPAVPAGWYRLTMTVSADPALKEMPFTLTVVRDVALWSNFWLATLALLAYPAYRWTRSAAFERARWEQSDYSD